MKKRAIPAISGANTQDVLTALKENVEQLTGQRGGAIASLGSSASTAQIISKVNEIIDRLMAT